MPTFAYSGRTRGGRDRQRRARRRHRWTPRSRRCAASRSSSRASRRPRRRPPAAEGQGGAARRSPPKNLAVFTRQFSVMIDAGLPLVQCLDILGTQEEDKNFAAVILQTRIRRRGGRHRSPTRCASTRRRSTPLFTQHDRRRRGGRYPRHDSQAARDLHREGRQAEGPGEVGDDLPDRRHRRSPASSSASSCGRSSRRSPRCSPASAPSCRCRRASSSR